MHMILSYCQSCFQLLMVVFVVVVSDICHAYICCCFEFVILIVVYMFFLLLFHYSWPLPFMYVCFRLRCGVLKGQLPIPFDQETSTRTAQFLSSSRSGFGLLFPEGTTNLSCFQFIGWVEFGWLGVVCPSFLPEVQKLARFCLVWPA